MDRLTSKQLKQLLDFLRAGCACHDQEAFVTHLLGGLSTLIPAEFTGYTEIDNRIGWVGEIRTIPVEFELPELREVFLARIAEHPIPTYYQQTGDGRAVKISDFLTQRQLHRLGLYQKLFRRVGVEDQLAISLASPGPREIGITLNRSRRSFTERDRLLLDLLRPHLVQAYANAQAAGAMRQEIGLTRQAMEVSGQAMVILAKAGRVRLMTPRAHQWLAAYFGPSRTEGLPEALRAWLRHQETALDHPDEVPPPREPLQVQRDGACLLVRHLCEINHCLLLLQERPSGPQSVSLEPFGLTRRESEVLQWIAQGKSNADIGCILDLSPRTVQKHVEHLFDKLGVETRLAAAALVLGRRSEG